MEISQGQGLLPLHKTVAGIATRTTKNAVFKHAVHTSLLCYNKTENVFFVVVVFSKVSTSFAKKKNQLALCTEWQKNFDHYCSHDGTNRWTSGFLHDRRQAVVVDGATPGFIPVA